MAIERNYSYITLYDFKKAVIPTNETTDDVVLGQYLRRARELIDELTGRFFYPLIATYYYDHPRDMRQLRLGARDLLEVTTLTTENAATTISSSNYYLMSGDEYGQTPYNRIVLKSDSTTPWFLYSGTTQKANAITGTWGYHEYYSEAWLSSNDTLKTTVNSSATAIAVNAASGDDLYGVSPRFKPGQLIQMGTEILYVATITNATNTLNTIRAVNGSTAAAHTAGDAIKIWRPMHDIEQACLDLATWLYRQQTNPDGGQVGYPSLGVTLTPEALPNKVRLTVMRYRRPL